jgi:hypothetical protein
MGGDRCCGNLLPSECCLPQGRNQRLGRQASRNGLVGCSGQLSSYAKTMVMRQKQYACEQVIRATFAMSLYPLTLAY